MKIVRCGGPTAAWVVAGAVGFASGALAQDFPAMGTDMFASTSPLCVEITSGPHTGLYQVLAGVDPATLVGRSAPLGEGTPPDDPNGAPVDTTGCPHCDATVSDADMTCWPAIPFEKPGVSEVHTEMLDLALCGGPCSGPSACDELCYLAGESAWAELNAIGQAGDYVNSYGEVEDMVAGSPNFPADGFFDIKAVIRITLPGGTIVRLKTADGATWLAVGAGIPAFPPPFNFAYQNAPGTTLPNGAGAPCGACPTPLEDPVTEVVVGEICCAVGSHSVEHVPCEPPCELDNPTVAVPMLDRWRLGALVMLIVGAGMLLLALGRIRRQPSP